MKPRKAIRRLGANSHRKAEVRRQLRRERGGRAMKRVWGTVKVLTVLSVLFGSVGFFVWKSWQWAGQTSLLALRSIEVRGLDHVGEREIREICGEELGTRLMKVDTKKCQGNLERHPWISTVDVSRRFPHKLLIEVVEHIPLAVGHDKGWYGLDPQGGRLPGLREGVQDLPIVEGLEKLDSVSVDRLMSFLNHGREKYPLVYANLSQLKVGNDGAEAFWRNGKLKLIIDLRKEAGKTLEFIEAIFRHHSEELEDGGVIDMRIDGYAFMG